MEDFVFANTGTNVSVLFFDDSKKRVTAFQPVNILTSR